MTRRRDTELLRQIGSRVRELRISRGLTQEEAANRSGFQSQTLSRVETAATSADLTTLARLADVLGVTLADIVDPGRPVPESVLSPEDAEFLAAVHGLRPDQRAALAAVVAAMR